MDSVFHETFASRNTHVSYINASSMAGKIPNKVVPRIVKREQAFTAIYKTKIYSIYMIFFSSQNCSSLPKKGYSYITF